MDILWKHEATLLRVEACDPSPLDRGVEQHDQYPGLHNHTRDGTRKIVGDLHVIGNLIVSGTVSAQEIVERDMPTDWPPSLPASPPQSSFSSTPPTDWPPSLPASPPQSSLSSTPPPQEPGAQEPPSAESTKRSAVTGAATGAVVGAAAGGVGAVAAIPAAVASMGFGASGITAGSTAAAMMAAEATAAGGGVAAGGTVATLQSIGAAGLTEWRGNRLGCMRRSRRRCGYPCRCWLRHRCCILAVAQTSRLPGPAHSHTVSAI